MSTPTTPEELADLLRDACEGGKKVQVVGGGSRSGYGSPLPPDVVLSMSAMTGIVSWVPDDLTLVVRAGTRVADIEAELAARSQTAVLPERPGPSTVGGVIAAGASSLRRGRLYATRERILETTVVTGDGRVVRSGGRVVKNVTGYDLSRLHFGAFGSLGVLISVCLKLWPVPPATATVEVESPAQALVVTRPLAVLEEQGRTRVYLWGTEMEVAAMSARLGGEARPGLHWPDDPAGSFRWSLRVPPALVGEALGRLPPGWRHLAIHGVGEVRLASDDAGDALELRQWAEARGGRLVVVDRPRVDEGPDPWGSLPQALDVQRALIERFDPMRIINPGRLPGGI
ncbi:MAG: FAD-binding protein [Actinobacteria bacterium]|nr:FAD-binding protein [Actinomycetota bacterium]